MCIRDRHGGEYSNLSSITGGAELHTATGMTAVRDSETSAGTHMNGNSVIDSRNTEIPAGAVERVEEKKNHAPVGNGKRNLVDLLSSIDVGDADEGRGGIGGGMGRGGLGRPPY